MIFRHSIFYCQCDLLEIDFIIISCDFFSVRISIRFILRDILHLIKSNQAFFVVDLIYSQYHGSQKLRMYKYSFYDEEQHYFSLYFSYVLSRKLIFVFTYYFVYNYSAFSYLLLIYYIQVFNSKINVNQVYHNCTKKVKKKTLRTKPSLFTSRVAILVYIIVPVQTFVGGSFF